MASGQMAGQISEQARAMSETAQTEPAAGFETISRVPATPIQQQALSAAAWLIYFGISRMPAT